MSREHKRPMLAFVIVAVVCGVLLLNAARSSAVGVVRGSLPSVAMAAPLRLIPGVTVAAAEPRSVATAPLAEPPASGEAPAAGPSAPSGDRSPDPAQPRGDSATHAPRPSGQAASQDALHDQGAAAPGPAIAAEHPDGHGGPRRDGERAGGPTGQGAHASGHHRGADGDQDGHERGEEGHDRHGADGDHHDGGAGHSDG